VGAKIQIHLHVFDPVGSEGCSRRLFAWPRVEGFRKGTDAGAEPKRVPAGDFFWH
jgi:hypothetical protein